MHLIKNTIKHFKGVFSVLFITKKTLNISIFYLFVCLIISSICLLVNSLIHFFLIKKIQILEELYTDECT